MILVTLNWDLERLFHPWRMRELMKTNSKMLTRLSQVLSEILEGCLYLFKSQPSFDSQQSFVPRIILW